MLFLRFCYQKNHSLHICKYNLLWYSKRKLSSYPQRILSGIQPTGILHIGNYFGAIEKWVELQNEGRDVICSIADLHAISLNYDAKILPKNILVLAATIIGCGIDPDKSILFLQSEVSQHTQLSWVLGCLTTMARLNRLPQFKEKTKSLKNVPLGIFTYPVLQAADILLYKATHVPVGEDQVQHIQLSRDLAEKFNVIFGETFPVPIAVINDRLGSKIKNLKLPDKKMSKSYIDEKSRIYILDSPDDIIFKLKKAVTDCRSAVTYEPTTRLGVSNLIAIHSLATGLTPEQICNDVFDKDTGQYKLVVADALIAKLMPIQNKIHSLLKSQNEIRDILIQGSIKAKNIAEETWQEVRLKIGTHYLTEIEDTFSKIRVL